MQWLAKDERLRSRRERLDKEGEEKEEGEEAGEEAEENQPLLERNQLRLLLSQAC